MNLIEVSDELFQKITETANATGRTVAEVVEAAVVSHLKGPFYQADQAKPVSTFACQAVPEESVPMDALDLRASSSLGLKAQLPSRTLSGVPASRQASLTPLLYVSEPVIDLLDGLLQGERSVGHALSHGCFGLGTLSQLDGEVVVLDSVAYHQGPEGSTKRLTGHEISPFMTVTRFDRTQARQFDLEPTGDYKQLQEQISAKFRSQNLVYAILIEGSFPYVQSRAVCKQEGRVRLKTAAQHQVVSEQRDMEGHLVGFWFPTFAGSSINVPGFHFHFLSAEKDHGGHVLELKMERGKAWLLEIHRAQVDFPFREEYLESELDTKQASGDLAAAES